jgi:hypothetical protein
MAAFRTCVVKAARPTLPSKFSRRHRKAIEDKAASSVRSALTQQHSAASASIMMSSSI